MVKKTVIEKSYSLIEKAKRLRALGPEKIQDCIKCLSEAICFLEKSSDDVHKHQLGVLYGLRALSIHEVNPIEKEKIFEDVRTALNLWSEIRTTDQCPKVFDKKTFHLLFSIFDILSLKGCIQLHEQIHQFLFRLLRWKNLPLELSLNLLWESRRLSHALCATPINKPIFGTLSKDWDRHPKHMASWINCSTDSSPLAGFQQNFAFPEEISLNDLNQTAAELFLSTTSSSSRKSRFLAACMWYDLCEKLISLGHLREALSNANRAYKFRCELVSETFVSSFHRANKKINFEVATSVATDLYPADSDGTDKDIFYLSPWKFMGCWLESMLQLGIVNEATGNGKTALFCLKKGKNLSKSMGFDLGTVVFCSELGKVYRKMELWDLAGEELKCAKQLLSGSRKEFSCSRCTALLKASVSQQLGLLMESRPGSLDETEKSKKVENRYIAALEILNLPFWTDGITFKDVKSSAPFCRTDRKYDFFLNCCLSNQLDTKEQSSKGQGLSRELQESSVVNSCICKQRKCWHCLPQEIMESGLLENFISLRWEVCRRRLSMRILASLGKCLQSRSPSPSYLHEILWWSISCLCSRNSFRSSCLSGARLLDLMQKEFPEDMFALERAEILYVLCSSSLKTYRTRTEHNTRNKYARTGCCDLSQVQLPRLVSWLQLAFVLCREAPILFEKVSRLLGVLYVLIGSDPIYSMPSCFNELSESQLASFFHQASIGSYSNNQICSRLSRRESHSLSNDEGSVSTDRISRCSETLNFPRLAPESTKNLEKFIINFFSDLPSSIVCISLLDDAFSSLVQEMLLCSSSVLAWIMLSRLSFQSQPIVVILPVYSLIEDSSHVNVISEFGKVTMKKGPTEQWKCPWGSAAVDYLIPAFRQILEANFLMNSYVPTESTGIYISVYWDIRDKLNLGVEQLLSDLEDLWLGSWRVMLLGERTKCEVFDAAYEKLMHDLKSKCQMDANGSLIKLILGGGLSGFKKKAYTTSELCSKKGCHIVDRHCKDNSCRKPINKIDGAKKHSLSALQLIHDAISKLEEDKGNRETIILVLDCGVQMLPWESMPILRKQEVYRMPSVASIFATLKLNCPNQDYIASLPLVDPLDAYYLLNPNNDLPDALLESWLGEKKLKGISGSIPKSEDWIAAMKKHDLFVYFGHGSGLHLIRSESIAKLENCAATVLMGCCSGILELNGCYAPRGAPIIYLLAGSPIVVACLWDISSLDINRFGKEFITACWEERSNPDIINIGGSESSKTKCEHRRTMSLFMGAAREACISRFLTGAAVVCYGVPTAIRGKD